MVKDGEGVNVDKLDEAFVSDVKFVLVDGNSEGLEVDKLDKAVVFDITSVLVDRNGEGLEVDKLGKAVVFDIKSVLVDRNGEGLEVDVVALNGLEVVFELLVEGANELSVDEEDIDGLGITAGVVGMAVVALGIGPGDVELEFEVLNVLTAGGK